MKNILVIGAGKSSTFLIDYLIEHAEKEKWRITVAEKDKTLVLAKIAKKQHVKVISLDIFDQESLNTTLQNQQLVISMLPTKLHFRVAALCAHLGIHFLTASYSTSEIRNLDGLFKKKGKVAIMELGLDPGLDHLSAMKTIDQLKQQDHKITGFETFTGGLLADESVKDNPWGYKFTWNPKNVILAGNGTSKFIQEGRIKYIPYHHIFHRTEVIHIPEHGYFEGYSNRDALQYIDIYQLNGIRTLFRGTLRKMGFSRAWDVFVQLGATDDSYEMENVSTMTHRQFINSFLYFNSHDSVELKLAHYMKLDIDSDVMFKLKWLDLFSEMLVGLERGTPAQILEHILMKKWKLEKDDRDEVIMWHKFNFLSDGRPQQMTSSLVIKGNNQLDTAMAKGVGLPLGIGVKLLLQEKIKITGVQIPTHSNIYTPILDELVTYGIKFKENH